MCPSQPAAASAANVKGTKDALLQRAAELVPVLKERAAETERLRQIPQASVRDLIASGLIRIGNPERYGGHPGVDYDTAFEVAWTLGQGCGSTAWCYAVWTVHAWMMGYFSEKAQAEFHAQGPDTLACSGFFPTQAQADAIDSGYKLSGRWEFSSGSDVSGWAMLGLPSSDPRAARILALVPRSDYTIVDTWFVSGLRGTGSKEIILKDAFVPSHRILDMGRAGRDDLTGWELHRRNSYRVPMGMLVGLELAPPLIGMAQGMVNEFVAAAKKSSPSAPSGRNTPAVQLRFAEASAEVDTARLLVRDILARIFGKAERGESFEDTERMRNGRNRVYAAKLCVQAVNRLFDASGGHSILDTNPMQRLHRDAHAASHHVALAWDKMAEAYGAMTIGAAG